MSKQSKIQIKSRDKPLGAFHVHRKKYALPHSHHYHKTKKISFCTVVRPSDELFLQTLPRNLEANYQDRELVDFVSLIPKNWQHLAVVRERFSNQLASSYLKIATYDPDINAVELRNICFQLAKGTILSNLETGSYTGNRGGNFIYKELTSVDHDMVFSFKRKWKRSSHIALWRDTFYEIGGFDEAKKYTSQCSNLIHRLNLYGIELTCRSNEYFTQSVLEPQWDFFDRHAEKEVKKLHMTNPGQYDISISKLGESA